MNIEVIGFEDGEAALSWLPLTEAIAAGHSRPIADIKDVFLYRGDDTVLSRSAWIDGIGVAVKTATVFPGNPAQGKPMIGGAVTLFSDADGSLEALIDFRLVTKWKTAGDSLLAALRLAPPKVENILIIGAGTVARSLLDSYGAGFPGASFRVWNRTPAHAEALGVPVAPDLAEAVAAADIVALATMSHDPILKGEWLTPGTHVDLIGAFRPDMREADDETLRRGRLFVDSRATTLGHIGELMIPLASGVITEGDVVADFTELSAFQRQADDITVFKNGGGAHLDLMVCRHILSAVRDAR